MADFDSERRRRRFTLTMKRKRRDQKVRSIKRIKVTDRRQFERVTGVIA